MNLICPNDKTQLIHTSESISCPQCKSKFGSDKNIFSFIDNADSFYEGAYLNRISYTKSSNNLLNKFILWLINSGYLGRVSKSFNKGDTLLELGCAAGVSYFGQQFNMIGCDLSYASLKQASNIYNQCLYADPLVGLPLPDNSIDGVISSYFWEHLDLKQKNLCLEEIHRVLKPGGKVVFLYDVETQNPLINYFKKRNFDLYKEHFLDQDGHIGYHTISENIKIFTNNKFSVQKNIPLEKTFIMGSSVYYKLAIWNKFGFFFNFLGKIGPSIFYKPFSLLIRIFDVLFQFLPDTWARINISILKVIK
jgi:ubiquinone/menaquinone biosynthesis C-methylase UbiE